MSESSEEESEPQIKIDLSAKAEIKGEASTRVVDRAVDALVDVISPFSEGMGLVGDNIRAHRYDVAIKIAKRAQIIANEKNVRLIPPPLKFTVPFLEKASIEDSNSVLTEMWSKLLVAASDEFQGVFLTYIQILSELSSDEAQFLLDVNSGWETEFALPSPSEISDEFENLLVNAITEFERITEFVGFEFDFVDLETVDDIIFKTFDVENTTASVLISVSAPYKVSNSSELGSRKYVKAATIAYTLQRQNLVALEEITLYTKIGHVHVEVACLTALGSDFINACMLEM